MINPNQLGRRAFPASASQWMLVGLRNPVQATGYSLSGPGSGTVGVASDPFTVALTGGTTVPGPVTVTPGDGGAGGTFTPSTVILNTGSTSATFTYTAASAGAKTISCTNNGGLSNPSSLNYTASAASSVHLLNTLISYWKLDVAPASVTPDAQGSNHLTLGTTGGGNPALATGLINNGMLFTAANLGFLTDANNATLQVTSDFTWSLWVKLTTNAAPQVIISKGTNTPGVLDYRILFDPANGFLFTVNDPNVAANYAYNPGSVIATGVWTHILAWWDSSDSKCHIRFNDTTTYTAAAATTVVQSLSNLYFGQDSANLNSVDGLVDEVGFWKRKLTAGEITALYNGGAGLPYSSFTA
jgi:hypothetical protein